MPDSVQERKTERSDCLSTDKEMLTGNVDADSIAS
jgi:hypothetical protein